MNVLSLFDGMSCGQIALKELGIKVDKYFASEIDKYAIAQTQLNFPDTIQLGDVRNVKGSDLPKIDLLIGGSPCQGFSFAGKQLNFNDPRSALFFEFVRILKEVRALNPDVKFLLENVRMKKGYEAVINNELGLFPVQINSALVSAQNRVRLYWSNIRTRKVGLFEEIYTDIPQPEDRGLSLKDILEPDVPERYFMSEQLMKSLEKHLRRNKEKGNGFGIAPKNPFQEMNALRVGGTWKDDIVQVPQIYQLPRGKNQGGIIKDKTPTLMSCAWEQNNILCISSNQAHATVSLNKSTPMVAAMGMGGGHVPMVVPCKKVIQISPVTESNGRQPYQQNRVYLIGGISPALCSAHAGAAPAILTPGMRLRRLTPTECSRLQTIPTWYVWKCSEAQQYKMLGNGWIVEVIKHIFSFL